MLTDRITDRSYNPLYKLNDDKPITPALSIQAINNLSQTNFHQYIKLDLARLDKEVLNPVKIRLVNYVDKGSRSKGSLTSRLYSEAINKQAKMQRA